VVTGTHKHGMLNIKRNFYFNPVAKVLSQDNLQLSLFPSTQVKVQYSVWGSLYCQIPLCSGTPML
jgi:hypothetical protein